MHITKVGNKIIPAAIIASTLAVGNVKAQKQTNTIPSEDKVEIVSDKTEKTNKNTVSWKDILFGFILGGIGGTVGAMAVIKTKNKMSQKPQVMENSEDYFTEQFKKDARGLRSYLNNILNNVHVNNSYTFDEVDFDKNTQDFAVKYMSRATYLKMLSQLLADRRLNSPEKYLLGSYLEDKATVSSEKEKSVALDLYGPILDGIEDYETLLSVFKANPPYTESQSNSDEGKIRGAVKTAGSENNVQRDKANLNCIKHDLKFSDVGGQDEAIKELKENILFPIKYPSAFKNDSINHCFVLYGPPGTGKTLISEALSNESNAYFVKLNGNDLTSKWVGETEENWRELFKDAIENQPSIIFIDEFDGIASARGNGDVHNDKAVNQILGLVSDIEKNNYQIFMIATTNRLDMIDKAMLRAGRFGKHIELKPPQTKKDVSQILKIHLSKKPFENIEKDKFDDFTEKLLEINATGADIALIVGEAYKKAKDRNHIFEKMDNGTFKNSDMKNVKIIMSDLEDAISAFQDKNKKKTPIGFNKKPPC